MNELAANLAQQAAEQGSLRYSNREIAMLLTEFVMILEGGEVESLDHQRARAAAAGLPLGRNGGVGR